MGRFRVELSWAGWVEHLAGRPAGFEPGAELQEAVPGPAAADLERSLDAAQPAVVPAAELAGQVELLAAREAAVATAAGPAVAQAMMQVQLLDAADPLAERVLA